MLLKDNVENFKKEARKYFNREKSNALNPSNSDFRYSVATNFHVYDLEGVNYYPNDFKESLWSLIKHNRFTQLTEVFKNNFEYDIEKHMKNQDEGLIQMLTMSDAGSVKIGNNKFGIYIPNGYGDGYTEVFITKKYIHIPLRYYTLVEGVIDVYEYDGGNEKEHIGHTIEGKYMIYAEDGMVVFNPLND